MFNDLNVSNGQRKKIEPRFVDRRHELEQFCTALASQRDLTVLNIYGDGGAGKTWLLERALDEADKYPAVKFVEPIDFYITENHSVAGFLMHIANQLGRDEFRSYLQKADELSAISSLKSASADTLTALEKEAHSRFIEEFSLFARKYQKIILAFDTFEVVQDEAVGHYIVKRLLPELKNCAILMAGRRNRLIDFGSLAALVTDIELKEINLKDAPEFFEKRGLEKLPDGEVKMLWQQTHGRPLLLDLALDWLRENPEPEFLLQADDEEEFEEKLVADIAELRQDRDRAILYMAWANRRLDRQMLEYIMQEKSLDYEDLERQLGRLFYVKYRKTICSYILHDEMRNMVIKHVWNYIDPNGTARLDLSRRIIEYYDDVLIPQAGDGLQRQILQSERLSYSLYIDLGAGYEHFTKVFDDLFEKQQYQHCDMLLTEMGYHRSRLSFQRLQEIELRRAKLLLLRNELERAKEILNTLLNRKTELETRVRAHLLRADYFDRYGDRNAAQRDRETAEQLSLALEKSKQSLRVKTLSELGYQSRLLGKWDEALKYLYQALEISTDPGETSNILNTVGYVLALKTEYEKALEYALSGLEIRQRLQLKRGLGFSHSTLGEIHRYKGDLLRAESHYLQALAIFDEAQDEENIARVLQQRGMGYVEMNRQEEAKRDFERSLKFYERSTNKRDYPRALSRVARLSQKLGKIQTAIEQFQKALDLAVAAPDIDTAVFCLVCLARQAERDGKDLNMLLEYQVHMNQIIQAHDYKNDQLLGQMSIFIGHRRFRDGDYTTAFQNYAEGMIMIGRQITGPYLIKEYLREIDGQMQQLNAQQTITYSQFLQEQWQNSVLKDRHPELISFCEIQQRIAPFTRQPST